MTMEIVKNNKGGYKLCFEGYTYTKKSISKTTIQWECSQRKAYVCKGKVTTDSQVARVIRTIEHSHDANLERVEATKIIASIKESAGTRRATPAQLYADHTQYATAHIRAEIGHQDAVKRTIRREKAKHLPISPVSLSDLEVTGEWTTTTMSGGSRTNNLCESWNRGFRSLVGTSHPTIWKALEHLRLDHHNVKTAIL